MGDWLRSVGLDAFGRLVIAGSVAVAYLLGRSWGEAEPRAWHAYGGIVVGVAVVWVFLVGGIGGGTAEELEDVEDASPADPFRSPTAAALALLVGGWIGVRRAQGPFHVLELFRRRPSEPSGSTDPKEVSSEMSQPADPPSKAGWLETGDRIVHAARQKVYDEAVASGARWLIEGHDLWDFQRGDEDLGVCFRAFNTDAEVDAFVEESTSDQWYRLAGIYDARQPLDGQGPGISPANWQAGHRSVAGGR